MATACAATAADKCGLAWNGQARIVHETAQGSGNGTLRNKLTYIICSRKSKTTQGVLLSSEKRKTV